MSVIFQVRGTQLDAYYARFAKTAGLVYGGNSAPAVVADASAGIFGGSYIQKANANLFVRALVYPGFTNTSENAAMTVLTRIIPRWTGAPTTIYNLVSIAGYSGSGLAKIELSLLTSGYFRIRTSNLNQSSLTLNDTTTGYTSYVSGTPVDIMFSWDGTTTANALKWSVNGVEVGTATASAAAIGAAHSIRTGITIGAGVDTNHSNYDLNEFVLFNSAENHVYSTRSDFYSVTEGEGFLRDTAKVKTGVSFYLPNDASVQTGTYTGSDRWSDPGEANVRDGTTYYADAVLKTGTLAGSVDPGESNVKQGVQYNIEGTDKTGTLYAPPAAPTRNWAPSDVQVAVYNHLATDDSLITLLGEDSGTVSISNKVFDHVPDRTAFPYVVMEIKPFEDRGNYSTEGLEATLTVHVWHQPGASGVTGRGDKAVQAIQKRIDEILHKSRMSISGWKNLILRRTLIDILVEDDNVTRHGVQQFKLFIGGT